MQNDAKRVLELTLTKDFSPLDSYPGGQGHGTSGGLKITLDVPTVNMIKILSPSRCL